MGSVKKRAAWPRRISPALVLLFSSPVIVEVLFGSTHLTIIVSLLPEIGFYGGAALLIRYAARRLHRGWVSILLLGVAFAVFEEFLVVQTSVSTVLFVPPSLPAVYGREFGVNWVYLLWAGGYESIWGIVLPIYLTELAFPRRRADTWLGKRGLLATVILFVLGSVVSWAIWTRVVAPLSLGSVYNPPLTLVMFAIVIMTGLVVVGLGPWLKLHNKRTIGEPRPLALGTAVFLLSFLWFGVVAFAYDLLPTIPSVLAVAYGLALAGVTLVLVARLTASTGFGDRDRLAIILGGLAASMIAGFWASGIVLPIDYAGKVAFDLAAVALLTTLARVRLSTGAPDA